MPSYASSLPYVERIACAALERLHDVDVQIHERDKQREYAGEKGIHTKPAGTLAVAVRMQRFAQESLLAVIKRHGD